MPVIMPRLVVEVYQHVNFRGRSRYVINPVKFTGDIGFQDNISSIKIYRGPRFKTDPSYKVVFHEHINFQGKKLILGPGFYPNLHDVTHNFPDRISSINFVSTSQRAGPEWGTIPYVVECYQHVDYKGLKVTVIRDTPHTVQLGIHDAISSIRIFKGPDAPKEGGQVILFEHINFEGAKLPINMPPMDFKKEIPNLHILPQSFGDMISSIKISGWTSASEFVDIIFEDEFDGNLMRSEWQWEDPRGGGAWEERQGYLQLNVENGQDLWHGSPPGRGGNMDAPRLLMPVSGDFAIETRLPVTSQLREHGGLVIWKNPMAFIRLEKTSGAHAFRGDVRFERHVNRVFQLVGRGPGMRRIRHLYLKIERRGNLFSGYASTDGIAWRSCGQTFVGMGEPVMVGLHALAPGNIPPTVTRFDYFRLFKRPSEALSYRRRPTALPGQRAGLQPGRIRRRITETERIAAMRETL